MRKVGEDITEILEYVPSRFEVVRHVRPAYSCAKCESMTQAPVPSLPIPRAMAGASTIAHVIMAKYADHLPLYRQAAIYAREGVELDRALLADWVGKAAWLVRPLVERIGAHVVAGDVIHAVMPEACFQHDTPVPVLAPGSGGAPDFRALVGGQQHKMAACFDLLEIDGKNMRADKLTTRRARLERLLKRAKSDVLAFSAAFEDAEGLLADLCAAGLEGIVSKQIDQAYVSGRNRGWIKVKCLAWREANRDRWELFQKRQR